MSVSNKDTESLWRRAASRVGGAGEVCVKVHLRGSFLELHVKLRLHEDHQFSLPFIVHSSRLVFLSEPAGDDRQ